MIITALHLDLRNSILAISDRFRFSNVNKSITSLNLAMKFESQKDYPGIHRMIKVHYAL